MEPLEFGKFIVQLIKLFWERLICCTVCDKGQAIIKKRLGYPIKWRTKSGLYWKIPFIDVFDKVDVRKKYSQFNAHSFYGNQDEHGVFIPYNILVDFQAEYQIVNPLGIYEASGLRDGEDIVVSYVGNIIHSKISTLVKEKGIKLSYIDVESLFKQLSKVLHKEMYAEDIEKNFDDDFTNRKRSVVKIEDCFSINEVVLTSFDKNISIRTTI